MNVFYQPWEYLMNVLVMLFVFIYAYWCLTLFPYDMMFALFNSNTTGVICGAGTASPYGELEFIPVF